MAYVIGVDVGGTNTDAVVLAGSTVIASAKRPTSQDKTSGVVDAIRAALESLSEQKRAEVVDNTARVSIGTTHFVNAVLERDRDRLSRVVVIRLCGSASRALPPFADFPADLHEIVYGGAYMVSGGLEYTGEPIAPISEEELKGCVQEILKLNPPVRNLVISGVFSPRDDPLEGQEVQAARIVKGACPDISCTLSHGLGLLGLLERENACILNEAIKPLAKVTIAAFHQALDQLGLKCPFYLTQNDGTLINAEEATLYPVLTFSSGPTNSMRGAAFLSGLQNAIVVDIGGTTTDVGVLRGGFPREASSQLEVGGVRTNFCMPDVKSIALGGGSFVQWDDRKSCVQVGPTSVGYRLTSEALCFGGKQCTATDVSIASGVAPADICGSEECWATVSRLGPNRVYAAMRSMRLMLEAAIDSMKVEKEDIPVLLVGGGSILVDLSVPLRGASRVVVPEHFWNVANAVGAALGTVGGTSDSIMNLVEIQEELKSQGVEEGAELERQSREEALERGRENAKSKAIDKGAVPATVYIHTEDVSDVAYVSHRVRVKVKAIGSLAEPQPTVEQIPDRDGEGGHSDNGEEKPPPPFTVQDNPHWPNCSAEDRARDEAAGLPPPRIQDKEWVLSSHDVECLALGAGILGCGGGGDPNIGRVMAQQVLAEGKEIRIVNPCRVDATRTGLLTSVAFMGAPAIQDEKLASGNETVLALRTLQQALACGVCRGEGEEGGIAVASRTLPSGAQAWVPDCEALSRIDVGPNADIPLERKVTTLLCSEVGGMNSIEPLLVSAQTGLPVIDADGMGRAFPELQMFLPFIYGSRPYPSCVADNKGEVICCSHIGGAKELEEFFRVECVRMGMSAGVAIGVLTLPEVMERCVLFSMSQAWQLGRAVLGARRAHNNVIDTIISQQHGTLMITGKVLSVIREVKGGFLTVVVVVEGLDTFAGHQVKLQAKNEYYIVRYMESGGGGGRMVEGPVLACTPDLITVIDSDLGFPITTEGIRYGMRVGVLALPANPRWKTDRALKVVGPTAFGFKDVEYAPPRSLYNV